MEVGSAVEATADLGGRLHHAQRTAAPLGGIRLELLGGRPTLTQPVLVVLSRIVLLLGELGAAGGGGLRRPALLDHASLVVAVADVRDACEHQDRAPDDE